MNELTVIKVGTGVLTSAADGTLNGAALVRLVTAVASLVEKGHRCLLVSSGAVGAGVASFGLDGYPEDLTTRQACAAVGQARLMHTYSNLFANFNLSIAQVLLTGDDISTPERSRYISSVFERLLSQKNIIPIVNENDSVAVEEIKVGDNDMLSARVACLLGAHRLILLTSVDGLLSPDDNKLVPRVTNLDEVESYASQSHGKFSIGGMASKLKAVRLALESGIEVHIAHGRKPRRLLGILDGEKNLSTHFIVPAEFAK